MKSEYAILRDKIKLIVAQQNNIEPFLPALFAQAAQINLTENDVIQLIEQEKQLLQYNTASGFISQTDLDLQNNQTSSGFISNVSNNDTLSGFISNPQLNTEPDNSVHFSEVSNLPIQGNMSITQKAKYLGKWVVVKRLKDQLKTNDAANALFDREFQTAYHLDHPHIVRINGKGVDAQGKYFFMEYIDGRTLQSMIRNNEMTPTLVRKISLEILDALSYVHKKQIYHRDLKPDNILVSYRGDNVKIVDFGLADSDDTDDFLTKAGTPRYAAPEQIYRTSQIDQRSDIYAFGLILLEMLSRDVNQDRINEVQPENYRLAIEKSLKKNPNERFDNCNQIIELLRSSNQLPVMLQSIKQQEFKPTKAAKSSALTANKKFKPKHQPKKMLWPVVGIVALLLVWFGLTYWADSKQNENSNGNPAEIVDNEDNNKNQPDNNSENENTENQEVKPVENKDDNVKVDVVTPEDVVTETGKISFTVFASSNLAAADVIRSKPMNIVDGKSRTAWAEGAAGDGVGEWLRISFSRKGKVTALVVTNGINLIVGSTDYFTKWGQVKRAKLEFSDGSSQIITLNEYDRQQQILKINPVETTFIKIKILEVNPGTRGVTCISEIYPEIE